MLSKMKLKVRIFLAKEYQCAVNSNFRKPLYVLNDYFVLI